MKAKIMYAIVATAIIVGVISILFYSLEYAAGLVTGALYMILIDWLVE